MSEAEVVVRGIEFDERGLTIGYVRFPTDVRKNGLLWNHSVFVPSGSDYDDEIEALTEALGALIEDVLDDEDRAEPVEVPTEEQDEEEDDDDDE